MTNNPRPTITFTPETYAKIKNIAQKEGKSISAVVRELTEASLTLRVTNENVDFITKIIREQVRDVMQPSVERLAALNAKTCVQSATAAFLCAETINRFVPPALREDVVNVYDAARKKGVAYTKQRIHFNDNGEDE